MNRKKLLTIAGCVGGFLLLSLLSYAIYYYVTFKKPNVTVQTELFLNRDCTYESLMDTLQASGAFNNWKSFQRAARKGNLACFKKGHYILTEGMSNQQVTRTLTLGWETPVQFNFKGYTKTLPRLCSTFANGFEADSSEFAEVFLNPELWDSLGFKKETFIGMFIPNTYEMYWTASPADIVKRMKKEYDSFWNEERRSKADSIKLSRDQVSTLASIIVGETNYVPEMPTIAGVYMNRLHKGMKLQACPTVIYAHLETEPNIRRVLNRHLTIDSPYNTYKYPGLPPGPIAVPTIVAIDAVLNYEETKYLYFAAKPEFNGTHNFASTYGQHVRNGQAYTKAFKERERARAKEQAKNSPNPNRP